MTQDPQSPGEAGEDWARQALRPFARIGNLIESYRRGARRKVTVNDLGKACIRAAEVLSGEGVDPWMWLASHTGAELSYGETEFEGEAAWQVHLVTGGVNDREWALVGCGSTPLAAVQDAASRPLSLSAQTRCFGGGS